jgi:hypothetical protein
MEACHLASKGDIVITQGSDTLDPQQSFRGTIRLRLSAL